MLVMNNGIPEKAERKAVGVKPIQPRASSPQTLNTAANHFQLIIFDCGQSVRSYKTLNGFLKKVQREQIRFKMLHFSACQQVSSMCKQGLKVGT